MSVAMTQEHYEAQALKRGIPDYMIKGLVAHIMCGATTGDFLTAIFSNDLMEAVVRADDVNGALLRSYAIFLYNDCEPACYGSAEKVAKWRKRGGQDGILAGAA